MDYVIPTWHPFLVHFPIVLLLLAGGLSVGYAVTGRALWRTLTGAALGLGTLGALFANRTGEALHDEVEGTPIVEVFVEQHEEFGEWALWLGAGATLVWLGVTVWQRRTARSLDVRDPLWARLLLAGLALAAAVLVLRAGHLGGIMVWGVAG